MYVCTLYLDDGDIWLGIFPPLVLSAQNFRKEDLMVRHWILIEGKLLHQKEESHARQNRVLLR